MKQFTLFDYLEEAETAEAQPELSVDTVDTSSEHVEKTDENRHIDSSLVEQEIGPDRQINPVVMPVSPEQTICLGDEIFGRISPALNALLPEGVTITSVWLDAHSLYQIAFTYPGGQGQQIGQTIPSSEIETYLAASKQKRRALLRAKQEQEREIRKATQHLTVNRGTQADAGFVWQIPCKVCDGEMWATAGGFRCMADPEHFFSTESEMTPSHESPVLCTPVEPPDLTPEVSAPAPVVSSDDKAPSSDDSADAPPAFGDSPFELVPESSFSKDILKALPQGPPRCWEWIPQPSSPGFTELPACPMCESEADTDPSWRQLELTGGRMYQDAPRSWRCTANVRHHLWLTLEGSACTSSWGLIPVPEWAVPASWSDCGCPQLDAEALAAAEAKKKAEQKAKAKETKQRKASKKEAAEAA